MVTTIVCTGEYIRQDVMVTLTHGNYYSIYLVSMFNESGITSRHNNRPILLSRKKKHGFEEELFAGLSVESSQRFVKQDNGGMGVERSSEGYGVVAVTLYLLYLRI